MVRVVFPQMRIVIIAFFVKTADAEPPAAVLVPADGFHLTGFYGNDWGTHLSHHIMSQMLPFIAVAAGNSEIIVILVGKVFCNGEKAFKPYLATQDRLPFSAGS